MKSFVPIVAALSLTSACSPHKVTRNPKPPIEVPDAFKSIAARGANLPDRWWQEFGDADLNALVDAALEGNLQVRAAWERVKQARAVAKQNGAARWPTLNFVAGVSQSEPANKFVASSPISFEAAYEVDVFRRLANTARAATVDAIASRDQVESLAMSLVAQIAETWFQLVAQRSRLKLLDEQIETSANFLELAEMRLGQGLGSSVDVLQQRRQLAAVEGQRPLLESAAAVLENQLSVLTGKAPGSIALGATDELPDLPARPAAGVPADLLLRRPDVRAARLLVESSDYRVAAAVAARLPNLRIGGSYGPLQRIDTDYSLGAIWSVFGNIFAPLFDGGRRKAEVSRTKAVFREQGYNYGQTLLQAMLEVENALTQESKQLEYIVELQEQLVIAEATLEEARQRYGAGIGDQSFLQILTALGATQQIQQSLILAQQQALSHRIQLCRALGGTWTRELSSKPQEKSSSDATATGAVKTSMRTTQGRSTQGRNHE